MTALELNTKKAELIKSIIIDADTEEIINELSRVLKKFNRTKAPCVFNDSEVRNAIIDAIEESKARTGTPHENIKRKVL